MKSLNTLPTLVLVLVLIGCSSSQPATTGSPTPAERDTTTAAETTEAQASSSSDTTATQDKSAALSTAPQDWYRLGENSRHAPGLATQSAHETILADRSPRDTVTVAIIDSGIDVDHEDLDGSMWRNGDEVPGNETDDDNNGYVDDVRGWNFIGGPDGENVDEDTYELTRIYARLRDRFADVDSGKVAPEARDAYQRFQEVEATFQENRQQAEKELTNVRKARDAVQFSEKVLSNYLGTKTITRAAVDTISTSRQKVVRARDILLYFYRQDLAPEDLYDYYDHLKTRVEYNYDPDFTPRSVVGDNYADKTERIYGNNDVVGPDANHGTHVSGIVAAERNNGVGIDGVASGVRLLPVRAVPNGDERDKDVANAIRYAVDNGADVINMSFGKAYSPHKDVVDNAVRYADSLGVLMVHAAGNDGENVDSTQNYPTRQYRDGGSASLWIEVGASSWKKEPNLAAPFSNYGNETVDVFAPGHSIYSTIPDGEYGRNDGTSMAAPMVSGVAALIMAHYPDLTAAQVREIILDTATSYANLEVTRPGSSDDTVRFGRLSQTGSIVNARDALERAEQMTEATMGSR